MTASNSVSARLEQIEPRVVLEMPWDVAVTLRILVAHVVAGESHTYGKHAASVEAALTDAGVKWPRQDRFRGTVMALPRE